MQQEMLKKIYPAYTEWCEEEKLKPLGKNTFAKRLEDMGFKADKDASGLKWFVALELNNDED